MPAHVRRVPRLENLTAAIPLFTPLDEQESVLFQLETPFIPE